MKFSYSDSLNQYIVTDRGFTIDADPNLSELLRRHGMLDEADETDLLNDFGCLPEPIPGEIIAWIDGEPVYATDDPGEVEATDDLLEDLDLSDFEEVQ